MNPFGEGAEVGYALEFVVGELDVEMLFDAGEEVEGLEAVDAELFEEIVVGSELLALHFEMLGGEAQDFVGGFVQGVHVFLSCHNFAWVCMVGARRLGEIGERVGAFDELAQAGVYRGAHEKVAKDVDFAAELVVRDRLDELLGGDGGAAIEFF